MRASETKPSLRFLISSGKNKVANGWRVVNSPATTNTFLGVRLWPVITWVVNTSNKTKGIRTIISAAFIARRYAFLLMTLHSRLQHKGQSSPSRCGTVRMRTPNILPTTYRPHTYRPYCRLHTNHVTGHATDHIPITNRPHSPNMSTTYEPHTVYTTLSTTPRPTMYKRSAQSGNILQNPANYYTIAAVYGRNFRAVLCM